MAPSEGEDDKNESKKHQVDFEEIYSDSFGEGISKINSELGSESTEYISNISDHLLQTQRKLENEQQSAKEERQKVEDISKDIEDKQIELEDRFHEMESRFDEFSAKTDIIEEDIDNKIKNFNEVYEKNKDLNTELNKLIEETSNLKDTASNLVKREAGASIGSEFAARRDELKETLIWWKGATVASILFLLAASFVIYYDIAQSSADTVSAFSKVTILLPISVAVWFTTSHYNQQKKLIEIYEFKADIALSLMGFREVLREELPEGERAKAGEFVVDTMNKIYANPFDDVPNSESDKDATSMGQRQLIELLKSGRNNP